MTLSIKHIDRTCLAIVVIVSVMCGYLALSHVTKQRKQIRQENALIYKRLRDLNMAETNLQSLRAALNTARKELASLNDQDPETARMGKFLKTIDSVMRERNTALINLEPLPPVEEELYTKYPIRLIFKGSFIKVYQVLHDLETMNRKVVMEEINISKSNMDQECLVDLSASIFES